MTVIARSLVVYLGYPSDLLSTPAAWTNALFESEANGDPLSFFISGGRVTSKLMSELSTRDADSRFSALNSSLCKSYSSRLLDSLENETADSISKISASTASSEMRVLADLWVLSRADIYVVDCDLIGRGRCGMEVMYANLMGIKTIGVSNSYSLDPWYHYHLDNIVKPASVLPQLGEFLDFTASSEARLSEDPAFPVDDYEPFEDVGFGD